MFSELAMVLGGVGLVLVVTVLLLVTIPGLRRIDTTAGAPAAS